MDILRRNNVRVSGRGSQPMLLAHGFGRDQHMWRFSTPAFETHYRVVLFDNVGAGGHCPNLSAPEETIATMRAYLASRISPRPAA